MYTAPFTLVHAGKYKTEDKLKIQTIHNTQTKHNPEKANNGKHRVKRQLHHEHKVPAAQTVVCRLSTPKPLDCWLHSIKTVQDGSSRVVGTAERHIRTAGVSRVYEIAKIKISYPMIRRADTILSVT